MAIHPLDVSRTGSQQPALADFARIYAAEFGFVWRVLRRFGVPPEQLEDAAQDVFVVWVRRGEELGREASVRTCLYGIARRVAAEARRSAARTIRRHEALAAEIVDRDESVEHTLETQHALAAIYRALRSLSAVQREVFLLAEVEGMSAQQIGAALRISPNTASSRLRLARQRLAATLGEARRPPPPDEPPAESRSRVWAALLPVWELRAEAAPASANAWATPSLLIGALSAVLALLALRPGAEALAPGLRPGAVAGADRPVPEDMPRAIATATGAGADLPVQEDMSRAPATATGAGADLPVPEDRSRAIATATGAGADGPAEPRSAGPAPSRAAGAAGAGPDGPGFVHAPSHMSEKTDVRAGGSRPAARRSRAPEEDPLAREARQIRRAQRLLQEDRVDAALAALAEHAAAAPRGRLADEREALRAAARCRKGEQAAALADVERWFAERPEARALAAARALCRHGEGARHED